MQLSSGQIAPAVIAEDLHRHEIRLPDANGRVTHLQFRRFAGCPICNVHLQSFVKRYDELQQAGVHEVVVFHSSREKFQPYQSHYPFEVICDPQKKLYRQFGVQASITTLFSREVWKVAFQGMRLPGQPKFVPPPVGGRLGLPADFLIALDGKIIAAFYGKHAYDQWALDEVLEKTRSWQQKSETSTTLA